jgi:DNA-binding response OmpR family regulator
MVSVSLGRILVIDDDEMIRALTCRFLATVGYDVQQAPSGKAGLVSLRQQHADVIITDIVMPDMEGLELIRALRLADPEVKIIAMSGSGQGPASYLDLALKFGARQVLPKPFTRDSLIAVVSAVLAT